MPPKSYKPLQPVKILTAFSKLYESAMSRCQRLQPKICAIVQGLPCLSLACTSAEGKSQFLRIPLQFAVVDKTAEPEPKAPETNIMLDRLYVAVPVAFGEPAAKWIFRPAP
jgi:hypothetical protein